MSFISNVKHIRTFIIWLVPVIGHPSGQEIELSCPLGTTCCVFREKFPQKPNTESFIDQAFSVKMAGYWPCSFFVSLWTSTLSRSINTQYPAILTSCLVNKPYMYQPQTKNLNHMKLSIGSLNASLRSKTVGIICRLQTVHCRPGVKSRLKTVDFLSVLHYHFHH